MITGGAVAASALAASALAVGATLNVGCGSQRPPFLTEAPGGEVASPHDGGGLTLSGNGAQAPCPRAEDGGTCGCVEVPLLGDPSNLYFVLDRSGSMTVDDKWTTIRRVVLDVMRRLGPRARFAAALFPDPRVGTCAPGIEVMSLRLGDTPAGTYGSTTATFGLVTNVEASGGTPTSATLSSLAPAIAALGAHTFVILLTDGGPNCNAATKCAINACIPNIERTAGCTPDAPPNCCAGDPEACLDETASVNAASALHAAGIDTYVVGAPGSGPYASVLNEIASAGGTSRYYDVTTADQAAFATTLSSIAAKITATCTFALGETPSPNLVNVYLDDDLVPKSDADGWRIDADTVTLTGSACDRVTSGGALAIRVVAGCPSVIK